MFIKKNNFLFVTLSFLLAVSSAWGAPRPHHVKKTHRVYLSKDFNRPYVVIGAQYYGFDVPGFSPSVTTGETSKILVGTAKNHQWIWGPTIAVGIKFYNPNRNGFHQLFGDVNSLEFNYAGYHVSNRSSFADNTGVVWFINGTGNTTGGYSKNITDQQAKMTNSLDQFGIYIRGQKKGNTKLWRLEPSAGLVFNDFCGKYSYSNSWTKSAPVNLTDNEDYKIKAKYLGVEFGEKLQAQWLKQFSTFVSARLQVLYMDSQLKAHQVQITYFGDQEQWREDDMEAFRSEYGLAYRGVLMLGANFKLIDSPDSAYITVMGGVDYWTDLPKIEPAYQGRAIKYKHVARGNWFSAIEFHAPMV